MTKGYWLKIVAGALMIFLVGMVVVEAFSSGSRKVVSFVNSDQSVTLPLFSKAFMLEGRDLGQLKTIQIKRSAPKSIEGLNLTVNLDSDASLGPLATCDISLKNFDDIDFDHTEFVCVSPLDMEEQDMVQAGTITFRPSGQVHVLNMPREVVEDLRNDAQRGISDAMDDVNTAISEVSNHLAGKDFQVRVNGKDVVVLKSEANGGSLTITDPSTGQTVFQANGTDGAGSITVNSPKNIAAPTKAASPPTPDVP